jgi:small subunit ribosomal protein S11
MAEDKTKAAESKEKSAKPQRRSKKSIKSVSFALIHISCSFNNTIITITDDKGNTIAWHTSGACGFKGAKKGTPFAAQIATTRAVEKVRDVGVKTVAILISGPGPGRETAIRAVSATGLKVLSIKDVTPLPHNGCRPPKARRV